MTIDLTLAVQTATAIRFDLDLQPPGGALQKVFPPTYPTTKERGPEYATEVRIVNGQRVEAVLLDSVPSQANRLEQALLEARRAGHIPLPLIEVEIEGYGVITDLDAPHRIYDAILLDSLLENRPFLESPIGRRLDQATTKNATDLFRYAPTTLLFGAWNSHAGQRVAMARFARALVSEIIGWPIERGIKTASRIDPLGITKTAGGEMYKTADGRWTYDKDRAMKDAKGKPTRVKPSEIGHGNIPPTLDRQTGGVSVEHVRQSAVLSLVQLRNLHFPLEDGTVREARDTAAQTVLASLALVALLAQWERGYQLRSGCLLQPLRQPTWRLCGRTAQEDTPFDLEIQEAVALLQTTVSATERQGLAWAIEPLELIPSPDLTQLLRVSREMPARTTEDEE